MININLLPKQSKEEIRSKRFNLYLTSITTIVLFIVGMIIIGLFLLKITLANQTKNLDSQIEEQKQAIASLEEQKNLINDFNSSVNLAGQLIQKETNWLNILQDLERATPEKIRLTQFSFGESGQAQTQTSTSTKVKITGIAESQREITKLIKKLEQSKYFSGVRLTSSEGAQTTSEEDSGVSAYNFTLSAQVNEQGSE